MVVFSVKGEELGVRDMGSEWLVLAAHVSNTTGGDSGGNNAFCNNAGALVLRSLEIFCHVI